MIEYRSNHGVEFYTAEKMNKLQLHTSTWMDFKTSIEHKKQIEMMTAWIHCRKFKTRNY